MKLKSTPLTTLLFLPAALAASSGCGASLPSSLVPGASTYNLTIASQSVIGKTTDREYILHLPSNYSVSNDVSAPLILAFHGQSQPAWSLERISELSSPDFNSDFIVAYPQGLNVQEPGVQWLGDPMAPNSTTIDDRIFVSELLSSLTSTLCIDASRIFAVGLSNGGGLTGLLMCDPALNKRFAAFATVAGAFYPDASLTEPLFQGDCAPELEERRLPYLNLHGTADGVVAYDGVNSVGPPSIPVPEWVGSWVERNQCSEPSVEVVENGTVVEERWACGEENTVVHRKIEGFGHGWPSQKGQGEPFETLRGGPTGWDATPFILGWFGRWAL